MTFPRIDNRITIVILFILLGISTAGIFFWNKRRTTNISTTVLEQTQQIEENARSTEKVSIKIKEWNNFDDLPVVKDCLIATPHTCFPRVFFNSEGGRNILSIQNPSSADPSDILDVGTVRSILLADSYYHGSLAILDDINGKGLRVEAMTTAAYANGINPIVVSDVIKKIRDKYPSGFNGLDTVLPATESATRLISVPLSSVVSQNIIDEVAIKISTYYKQFMLDSVVASSQDTSANEADLEGVGMSLLSSHKTYTPLQKALLLFFLVYLDKQSYIDFVNTFSEKVPTVGTYELSYASPEEVTPLSKDGYLFCDKSKNSGVQCYKRGDKLLCTLVTMEKLCRLEIYSLPSLLK